MVYDHAVIRRSIVLASLVLAAAVLVPAAASAQTTQELSADSVAAMLTGFEQGPEAERWSAIGPAVVPVLAEIASDAQRPGFVRIRAITAAGHFATPEARGMLRAALRSPEPLFVRAAALAMHRAFGASALRELVPLLAAGDTAVREAAIRTVGAIAAQSTRDATLRDEARTQLRRRLAREPDEALREELERRISGVGGSSPG